jgi:hypothetical protein
MAEARQNGALLMTARIHFTFGNFIPGRSITQIPPLATRTKPFQDQAIVVDGNQRATAARVAVPA